MLLFLIETHPYVWHFFHPPGLSDYVEVIECEGCNATLTDTDNEGLNDKEEYIDHDTDPADQDSDGDGLSDFEEVHIYGTDPNDPNTDGDCMTDGEEVERGTNPLVSRFGSFNRALVEPVLTCPLFDLQEADSDGDGVDDCTEIFEDFTDPMAFPPTASPSEVGLLSQSSLRLTSRRVTHTFHLRTFTEPNGFAHRQPNNVSYRITHRQPNSVSYRIAHRQPNNVSYRIAHRQPNRFAHRQPHRCESSSGL